MSRHKVLIRLRTSFTNNTEVIYAVRCDFGFSYGKPDVLDVWIEGEHGLIRSSQLRQPTREIPQFTSIRTSVRIRHCQSNAYD